MTTAVLVYCLLKWSIIIYHYCCIHTCEYSLATQVTYLTLYYQSLFFVFSMHRFPILCIDYGLQSLHGLFSLFLWLIAFFLIYHSCMQTGFLRVHQFQLAIFHLMSIILYSAIYQNSIHCIQWVMSPRKSYNCRWKMKRRSKSFQVTKILYLCKRSKKQRKQ